MSERTPHGGPCASLLCPRIVVMGVSGCGKSSVAQALAERLGAACQDGDDLHPPVNIEKMRRGLPLTDADRWPWLTLVGEALRPDPGRVIACSALKRAYRDRITQAAEAPVLFVCLEGPRDLIAARMAARSGHFMPPTLLDSQFATLEPPGPDESAITVSIDQPLAAMIEEILSRLSPPGD